MPCKQCFFLLATVWTMQMSSSRHVSYQSQGPGAHEETFGQSIIEGWKFSWRNEVVRSGDPRCHYRVAIHDSVFNVVAGISRGICCRSGPKDRGCC